MKNTEHCSGHFDPHDNRIECKQNRRCLCVFKQQKIKTRKIVLVSYGVLNDRTIERRKQNKLNGLQHCKRSSI